jgi:repressor LexA
MTNELPQKQRAIYQYIQRHMEEFHVPPSLRDIGTHLGVSVGTVQKQVECIRKKGFLERTDLQARGLRLPMSAQKAPILGCVHAGPLHPAFEDVEGHVSLHPSQSPSKHFALRVRGDSMIGEAIREDDLVVVRSQQVAEAGDIVVALVGDETTVKCLKRKGHKFVLEPANPAYESIEGPFDIVGVVVEVRRQIKK